MSNKSQFYMQISLGWILWTFFAYKTEKYYDKIKFCHKVQLVFTKLNSVITKSILHTISHKKSKLIVVTQYWLLWHKIEFCLTKMTFVIKFPYQVTNVTFWGTWFMLPVFRGVRVAYLLLLLFTVCIILVTLCSLLCMSAFHYWSDPTHPSLFLVAI